MGANRGPKLGEEAGGGRARRAPEVQQASSAQQMENQQTSLGPVTMNEGGPVEGVQTANAHPKQPSQFSPEPVQASVVSVFMTSINSSQSGQMTPSVSEGASQKLPSEPGTSALEGGLGSLAPCFLAEQQEDSSRPGTDGAHKEPPPSSESEGKKPNGGAPQEEREGFLCAPGPIPAPAPRQGLSPVSRDPESGSAAQDCPDQEQTSSKTVIIVYADGNTGSTAPPPGALEVARQAPNDGGRSGALPSSSEALGEAGPDQTTCGSSDPTAASSPLILENQEPTVGVGDPSLLPLEVDPGADVMPSPSQKRLGDACALPSPAEPVDGRADEQSSKGQLDPKPPGYSLSLGITSPSEDREVVNAPPQGPWIRTAQDSAERTVWGCSSPMELDFLADSQIQGALDTPDFEALPEQPSPVGSRSVPCWPGTSPPADGAPISTTQPRTCDSRNKGIKAAKAPELEDATATVCGLVMELSNLNRLIMSTHRDLEACKRLSYRQGKLAGKIPAPYASKGAGNIPRGEQAWRDKGGLASLRWRAPAPPAGSHLL
ncbi:PREDICTED: uncharacterized protein C19orf57 homolog [Chrysochloris asiatica]|uniref:Uncharacterized protein C19orf57 homolog n=1 Tax=Chrysochloris asiatica TaxID=185453 RepID=A0A9B0U265_CHRAS|nr:PREDICTED: uncharacterized protein C19orf57 homolog [Chrysochloris asiatica]